MHTMEMKCVLSFVGDDGVFVCFVFLPIGNNIC